MSLPQFVVPVVSIAGPATLAFAILRCFPSVTRAVVTLVAGLAAVLSKDKERREASIRVLYVLSRKGGLPSGEETGSRPEISQTRRQRNAPR